MKNLHYEHHIQAGCAKIDNSNNPKRGTEDSLCFRLTDYQRPPSSRSRSRGCLRTTCQSPFRWTLTLREISVKAGYSTALTPAPSSGNFEDFGKTEDAKSVSYLDEYSLDYFSDLTVDTFMSSNRLLFLKHDTKRPDTKDMDHEERDDTLAEWNKGAVTEIAGYCTNSKRQRLFAFCDIVERLLRGDNITEDDPIFDQFNAKFPKCGKVYENQYRRVCTN